MALRGEAHRAAIRAVLDAFGADARHFVFIGGCTLGLYARPDGAPLRATKDVDCISTLVPWVLQEKILGDMCSRGVLSPDADLQCRYRIRGTELDVDVLSPAGFNVGGVNPWFERAAQRARAYDVGEGRLVMALTPPYFLTTKLVAFADRGPDAQSSKDLEDCAGRRRPDADAAHRLRRPRISPTRRGEGAGARRRALRRRACAARTRPAQRRAGNVFVDR